MPKTRSSHIVTAENLNEAWEDWYVQLASVENSAESRDGAIHNEILNAITIINDPTRNIMKSKIRSLPMRYCIGELLWYLSGNPMLSAIRLYTDAWDRMSDNGVTVNSNYGNRIRYATDEQTAEIFNQLDMVESMLTQDPLSRQAVIHIKGPRNILTNKTKDVNCTVCLQFLIRDGLIYMTTYMRSNDLWMGFPNDIFQFTCMQIYLAMRLNTKLGTYTHIAGSLHLYERDYQTSLKNIEKYSNTSIDGVPSMSPIQENTHV